jgi:hypothetical protein
LYERGTGRPAVVLEAGYRSSARIWSEDLHQSGAPPMGLASVAAFTRGCAYDRPGRRRSSTTTSARAAATPSPCRGPALDAVADLQHCSAPQAFPLFIPLRRPSLGGSLSGSTPAPTRDVLGLVLVDAYSETLETLLTPQRWAALARSTCSPAATR